MRGVRVQRAVIARLILVSALALGGLSATCKNEGQKAPASPAPATARAAAVIDTGARTVKFRVELAMTPEEQARGLMYRTHLDTDAGMLFVSRAPRPQSFWMKNTLIPLDMIFIGGDRRIVGIVENAQPETETARFVDGLSQYVLEIGGGLSARLGIRAGQPVDFEGVPTP
jgi:uncharacterized membrane protein (UPF0127 family)